MTATLSLSALYLHPAEQRELRWFFQSADGALGASSNFWAVINAGMGGRNKGSKPVSAARAFQVSHKRHLAAARARDVGLRLAQIDPYHQRTLAAAYGPGLPRRLAPDWRELSQAAGIEAPLLLLTCCREGVARAKLLGHEAPARAALERLAGHARGALALASVAYTAVG
jgi:hypothetical protein